MLTIFDAVKDFRLGRNGSGAWSYGYSAGWDADYRLIEFDAPRDQSAGSTPNMAWNKAGYIVSGTPAVWRNLAAFPRYGVAPGQLALHPGPRANGDFTIVRFTVPGAGRYRVSGQFFAGDTGAMSGRVLRNGDTTAPLALFASTTDASVFNLAPLDLQRGEILDFVVGNNGNFTSGNTPLTARIEAETAQPLPQSFDATADFQVADNQNLAWRYGYSVATGAAYAFIPFDSTTDLQPGIQPGIGWSKSGYLTLGTPSAWLNHGDTTRYGVGSGQLSLHPGPRPFGDVAVLRFVAPRAGRYAVAGRFMAGDAGRSDGAIVQDGQTASPLKTFAECRDDSTFAFEALTMSAGGTLDFIVGNKGNFSACNTPVEVGIREVPGGFSGNDIDAFVDGMGRMPVLPASQVTDVGTPAVGDADAAGVAYRVTSQRRQMVNDVVEHAYLADIAAMGVWPGQVIQAEGLKRGNVNPIGPFRRRPGRLEIVTPLITGTPMPQFRDLPAPDAATANAARQALLAAIQPTDSAGSLKTGFQRASSLREVGLKLGLTVSGAAFGVDANAKLNASCRRSVVVGVIRQVFYSTTFTPASAGASGIWDAAGTTAAQLGAFMRPGNPPLLVDSVQYGRLICVTAEGSYSSEEMAAALTAHYDSAVKVGGSVDANTRRIIDTLDVKIYTLGVPGHLGFEKLTDPVPQLDEVYKRGLVFNLGNPGAPISFTCKHVADATTAHVQLAAEYTETLSAVGVDVRQAESFVFDGPGGGSRDTGITVNAADRVAIRADGMIWSGVVASGLNGPEGWPGHVADPAAPLPDGTAYCLVHKFSRDRNWRETKRFWEGSAETGGRLLLNTNDNNPYNGDPAKQWRVRVDVTRANAAAVGLYI